VRHLRHLPSRQREEGGLTSARRALGAIAILVGAAVLAGFPLCPFASLTGVPCPACGLGRGTLALLQGDWAAALQLHPLTPIAVPLVVGLTQVGAGPAPSREGRRLASILAGALLAALLVVWVARFLGAFGGPTDVDTYREYLDRRGAR
jgi:hypothetical protein